MRALTIQQPYAHLIVTCQTDLPEGAYQKRFENRVTKINRRGQIAIHAGVSTRWFRYGDWPKVVKKRSEAPGMMFGAIVGLADIVDCVEITSIAGQRLALRHHHVSGPWVYCLGNVRRLTQPVSAKGSLGFWNVGGEIEQAVLQQELVEVPYLKKSERPKNTIRFIRTQLECVEISPYMAGFFVAGRAAGEVVRVKLEAIPYEVRRLLKVGKIVHAMMEVGVVRGVAPSFDRWEDR